ncbi:glucose-6-phosphate isomerase [Desulfosporosinus sp. PR]|uniref:glucose-6-phosphate isomerase n=1 Tax=Candidatus Desulfosporosinus nitrosoreducens TaxID=3401928 RepID=UPI0027FFA201|nr:glucose-6-phosphate isomerase [Desulfosporosinus sp. PR]MDQ7092824.1 glucose-6-phosphate isomerase [Desulfosporosinus sp. PR]
MKKVEISFADGLFDSEEIAGFVRKHKSYLEGVLSREKIYQDSLGWLDVAEWASDDALKKIEDRAREVRQDADVFVLIGVGGSNQAARAVISALPRENAPEILYAGNNLSADYLNKLLQALAGKSVYINAIAKNFETLEPGLSFRVLRQYLEQRYGGGAAARIAVTGTKGSSLQQLALDHGYTFFTFPENIGGRYSALCDVGLFPMAVAGIDIGKLVRGAQEMRARLLKEPAEENIAFRYAAYRNLLQLKDYRLEMLSFFEPRFYYFSKWWIQLFAESEGKDGKGVYPVAGNFSEDLHSIGQFVQEGRKMIFETFLDLSGQDSSLIIAGDDKHDYFDYLDGKDLWEINKLAFQATFDAHRKGGIPCLKLTLPELDEYYFGQLFYLFMVACYLSGKMLEVNPFDQGGVERYKENMFKSLGK